MWPYLLIHVLFRQSNEIPHASDRKEIPPRAEKCNVPSHPTENERRKKEQYRKWWSVSSSSFLSGILFEDKTRLINDRWSRFVLLLVIAVTNGLFCRRHLVSTVLDFFALISHHRFVFFGRGRKITAQPTHFLCHTRVKFLSSRRFPLKTNKAGL